MFRKSKFFLVEAVLATFSPLASMCMALKFYKRPISWLFMIVFAYYFGSHMWLGNDATDHYVEMKLYYWGYSYSEIRNNPIAFLHSPEPYCFILKYIVSRFTDSYAVFGGVICAIYMILQIGFLTSLKRYYANGLSFFAGLLLIAVFTVVQFSWFQGVRFWPGVFWFMTFIVRYAHTRRWYHLALACMCPLIHYSLAVLPIAVGLNYLLMRCGSRLHVIIFLASFFIRLLHIDFLPYILEHIPVLDVFFGNLGAGTIDRDAFVLFMENVRADDNPVYSIRSEAIAGFLVVLLGFLRLKKVVFSKNFQYAIAMAMTIGTIANIEYVDITFYDRFFKLAVLFFALSVFIVVAENQQILRGRSIELIALAGVLVFFEIITHVVAMRIAYLHPELWFGNFFMDWHGGLDADRMSIWGDLFR